ncbi:NADase-type glycan-binding domain-containing protein [Pyxidicoccus sp. 3LG]
MQGHFDEHTRGRVASRWVAFLITGFVLTLPGLAAAQAYEGRACTAKGSHPLKGLQVGASLAGGVEHGLTGDFSDWASSTLLPKGKPPACEDCPPEAEDDLREREMTAHKWTCGYSAEKAMDGKPDTAWCEGAKGTGAGEVLLAKVEPGKPVSIWAGFGKSAQLHAANARPRKVRLAVLQARSASASQSSIGYGGLTVAATGEVELKDVNDYQELKLPAFEPDSNAAGTFVAIEVLSVYPGKKFTDLCISELRASDKS